MNQGEVGVEWVFVIKDDQGNPIDLAGATIKLLLKRKFTVYERDCSIVDALAGKAKYVLTAEDLAKPGVYAYQLVLTYIGGMVIKTIPSKEIVEDSLEGG